MNNIPDFSKAKILVVGDIMLDKYLIGDTKRISPEAPVPIVKVEDNYERLGGAANVALNLSKLKCKVGLIGIVGDDGSSKIIQKKLREEKIRDFLIKSKDYRTIEKLRLISRNQQLLRLDFEENLPNKSSDDLLKIFRENVQNYDLVILSDYNKGCLIQANKIIDFCRREGIKVIVDPKQINYKIYKGATLITPNFKEFELIVGKCENLKKINQKGKELIEELNLEGILLTMGEKGIILLQKDKESYVENTKAREVFDVTGAGDTVIAITAACIALKESLERSVSLANLGAGIVVGRLGTNAITIDDIKNKIGNINSKLLDLKNLKKLLKVSEDNSEKIVMTNGCFDILHSGHVQFLEQAKKLGDKLIIAINTDKSVKNLKGQNRPINNLKSRIEVLKGLSSVDWIIPFDEETPEKLIELITPNILVKGSDYEIEKIAGAQHVFKNGGEVFTINLLKGHSTTNIIEKIKNLKNN